MEGLREQARMASIVPSLVAMCSYQQVMGSLRWLQIISATVAQRTQEIGRHRSVAPEGRVIAPSSRHTRGY